MNTILPLSTAWINLEGIILGEISQRKTDIKWYNSYVESKKMQQTSEYNKKRNWLADIENKPMVTNGVKERGRGNAAGGEQEGQAISYKMSYKDTLQNIRNMANIL